jgi:hypothetical protein
MNNMKDYEELLRELGIGYFVQELQYVPDISIWTKENDIDLGEPHHPMKLIAKTDDTLVMVMQEEVSDKMLNDVINNLSVRWSLKDNATDIDAKLSSTKKKIAYCFLKERARTMKDVGRDDLIEDQWVLEEMEMLGFFKE